MLNVFLYVIFLNQRLKLVSLKEDSGKGAYYILNTTVTISKKALQEIRGSDTNQNTLPINYQSIHEQGSTNEQLPRRYLSRDILHVACLCLWPLYSTDHCPIKLTNEVRSLNFSVWNLTTTFIHIVSSLFKLRILAIDDN